MDATPFCDASPMAHDKRQRRPVKSVKFIETWARLDEQSQGLEIESSEDCRWFGRLWCDLDASGRQVDVVGTNVAWPDHRRRPCPA
jgi:hypothetical protein